VKLVKDKTVLDDTTLLAHACEPGDDLTAVPVTVSPPSSANAQAQPVALRGDTPRGDTARASAAVTELPALVDEPSPAEAAPRAPGPAPAAPRRLSQDEVEKVLQQAVQLTAAKQLAAANVFYEQARWLLRCPRSHTHGWRMLTPLLACPTNRC
jgi:hypothetical protein